MRTIDDIITRVRRETRNLDTNTSSSGSSIADAEFVDALQDAQELCQELIASVYSKIFETTKEYNVTANDETYTLPDDILLGTRIGSVEFAYDTNKKNYYNLHPVDIRERYSSNSYNYRAQNYIRSSNQIILTPIPSGAGLLRITYERKLPILNKYFALGSSRNLVDPTLTLTVDSATINTDVNAPAIGDTVNIVKQSTGEMIAQDGEVTGVSTYTYTIDLTNATYVAATVSGTDADDMALMNKGETNICELPDSCEKFLSAYAVLLIFERDASKLAVGAQKRFERIKESILQSYIGEDTDWPAIPQTDY